MNTIAAKIRAAWLSLPEWIRKFFTDAVEGAVTAIVLLNLAFPGTLEEAKAQAVVIAAAVASPIISAARRHLLPGILGILRYLFPAALIALAVLIR